MTFVYLFQHFVNYFSLFTILVYVSGAVGNLVSIVIFGRRILYRNVDNASNLYLLVLAISDFFLGTAIGISLWFHINIGFISKGRISYPRFWNKFGCQLMPYMFCILSFMSSWTLIFYSTERALILWQPFKMAPFFKSSKPRKLALIIAFVTTSLICVGVFDTMTLRQTHTSKFTCLLKLNSTDTQRYYSVAVGFGINLIVPVFLISVLNLIIILAIKRNRMIDNTSKDLTKSDRKTTRTLLLISLFYVIFILPYSVTYSLQMFLDAIEWRGLSKQQIQIFHQVWTFVRQLQFFNNSCNPFIYCFSIDTYRTEFRQMFCPRFKTKRRHE